MSKIRSENTKPEIILRRKLRNLGYNISLNNKSLVGKPDISLGKYKLAIFVDGEFWHGYNWGQKKKRIKSNREYWVKKIERNKKRDRNNNQILRKTGWEVLRFWEHEILGDLESCTKKITSIIKNR